MGNLLKHIEKDLLYLEADKGNVLKNKRKNYKYIVNYGNKNMSSKLRELAYLIQLTIKHGRIKNNLKIKLRLNCHNQICDY